MGLDMYLEVEVYVSRPVEWMKEESIAEATPKWEKILSLLPGVPSDHSYGATIQYTVAYWRKANAIHKWFVDNVQDSVDNCERSYVDVDQLKDLLALCNRVVDSAALEDGRVKNGSHAGPDTGGEWVDDYEDGKVITNAEAISELLPTKGGFFFGDTSYNEYYLEHVKDTIKQLTSILEEYKDKSVDFYYRASW